MHTLFTESASGKGQVESMEVRQIAGANLVNLILALLLLTGRFDFVNIQLTPTGPGNVTLRPVLV